MGERSSTRNTSLHNGRASLYQQYIMGKRPSTSNTSIHNGRASFYQQYINTSAHIREACIQPNTDGLDPLCVFSHRTVHNTTTCSVPHTRLLVCADDHSNFLLSQSDLCLPTHCSCRRLPSHLITFSDTASTTYKTSMSPAAFEPAIPAR